MRHTPLASASKSHTLPNGTPTKSSVLISSRPDDECPSTVEHREANETIARLRAELVRRDEFIATAAHELRNAMAAVLVNAGNMVYLARKSTDAPPWLGARLGALERQARHFVRRATALLDASRLASGYCSLQCQWIDLGASVEGVISELAPEAHLAGSELCVAVQRGAIGFWDAEAAETIAINLLSNAIKYGAGSPISVGVTSDAHRACLTVCDGGIGIPPENHARIFQRFERATIEGDQPGFGLGLWIARQLAVAHGGDITVKSTPGHGSVFTATLPRGIHEPQQ